MPTWFLKLGKPVAKLLGNTLVSGIGGDLAGELVDNTLKPHIEKSEERRVQSQLGAVGAAFVRSLSDQVEEFAAARAAEHLSVEAVVVQIEQNLKPALESKFFLAHNLEPKRIEAAVREKYPLPAAQFSQAETDLYGLALHHAIRGLVDVAHKLKGFASKSVAEQLKRLAELQEGMGAVFAEFGQLHAEVLDAGRDAKAGREHAAGAERAASRVDGRLVEVGLGVEEARRKVTGIDAKVDVVLKVLAAERGSQSSAQQERNQYEDDYRKGIEDALDELELFGVDLTPETKKQKLSVAYISLSLEAPATGDEAGPTPVEAVLDQLKRNTRRLLIRGEAGSGKSTLFRWAAIAAGKSHSVHAWVYSSGDFEGNFALSGNEQLLNLSIRSHNEKLISLRVAREEIEKTDRDWQAARSYAALAHVSWRFAIPFLIPLRNCTKGRLPPIESLATATLPLFRKPPDGWVHQHLKAGRALVLIDGIDEVPKKYRAEVRKQLRQLVTQYPDCYYVVSTRPAAVDINEFADLNFREATVAPMSERDRGSLIDNWHKAVREQILKTKGEAEAAKLDGMADRLKAQLRDNPPIARLASNPLLAAMVCALHRDRNQKLPNDLNELVEALCHMILFRRERESGLDLSEFDSEYRDLTYPQRKALVANLAEFMVEQEVSALPEPEARGKIADALRTIKGRGPKDATAVLKGLIERSGILREKAPGTIDFIHNTFKEFLAAGRMVRGGKYRSLASRATSPDWENVLLFAAAAPDDEGFATRLIAQILPTDADAGNAARRRAANPDAAAVEAHARRLMAIRLRAVAQHLDPGLDDRLKKLAKSMLPPKTLVEAATLAAIGDPAVGFLKYTPSLAPRKAIACVRALRLVGTDAARARLAEYAVEVRMDVIAELAQAINPLDIPEVRRRIATLASQLPAGVRAQITDLSPLAGLTGLTRLELFGTRVADVSPLAGLTGLTTLGLSGTAVADVSPLAGLTGLTTLDLTGTAVLDVSPLAGLTGMTRLDLTGTPVADVSPLAGLTGLTTLNLTATAVTDLSSLAGLTGLTTLYLFEARVADVSPLAGLTGLTALYLSGTRVADVSPLAGLTGLTTLDLRGTPVADASPLAGLTGLTALLLGGTRVADASPLARLTNLSNYDGPPIPGRRR